MSVSVYVYVTHDMTLLAPFLNTPLLLYPSPDRQTHCVFFCFLF